MKSKLVPPEAYCGCELFPLIIEFKSINPPPWLDPTPVFEFVLKEPIFPKRLNISLLFPPALFVVLVLEAAVPPLKMSPNESIPPEAGCC